MTTITEASTRVPAPQFHSYSKETVGGALHLVSRFAQCSPNRDSCHPFSEFYFWRSAPNQEASTELCDTTTKIFELFANVLTLFNPGKEPLFKRVQNIGLDHVCLRMHCEDVDAFEELNFREPYGYLTALQEKSAARS